MYKSKFYFECHITIEPAFDEKLDQVKELSKRYAFKVADLLMKKGEQLEKSKIDTFITSRDVSYENLEKRMLSLIKDLKDNHFKVYRCKIEDTLMDTNIKNPYGDLISER